MFRYSISVPKTPASLAADQVYASSPRGSFAYLAQETATLRFVGNSGNSFLPRTLRPKSWATLSSTMSTLHFQTSSSSSSRSIPECILRKLSILASKSSSSSSAAWTNRLFHFSVATCTISARRRAVALLPTPPDEPTTTASGRDVIRKVTILSRWESTFVPPGTATWSATSPDPVTAARYVPSRASDDEHTPTTGMSPVGLTKRFSPR
mmetsp:Transcript_34943/g.78407  ORF Transcript_34943/g.78407 Transcript_34943/m.78407 type:complete len:209 (+) Transcript_34943:1177-1803(+)